MFSLERFEDRGLVLFQMSQVNQVWVLYEAVTLQSHAMFSTQKGGLVRFYHGVQEEGLRKQEVHTEKIYLMWNRAF